MNTMIQTRIDANQKQQAEVLFNSLGTTLNEAIRMFIAQSLKERALPFRLRETMDDTEYLLSNPETVKHLRESIAQAEHGELHDVKLEI